MEIIENVSGPHSQEETAEHFGVDFDQYPEGSYWFETNQRAWLIQPNERNGFTVWDGGIEIYCLTLGNAFDYCLSN